MESSAQWFAQHPGITVVSRDRSALYAGGITRGAPHAVQVVDRFHLVANLREALEAFFSAQPSVLKEAAARTAQSVRQEAGVPPPIGMYRGRRDHPQNWKKRQERQRQQRHAARVELYETICRLKEEGTPIKAIARQLKMSRSTVYVHLDRGTPPEPRVWAGRQSDQILSPYLPYLRQRWHQGENNANQLWREIQAQGCPASARTVRRLIMEWRRASKAGRPPEIEQSRYTRPQGPTPRSVSFVVVSRPNKRSKHAQLYLEHLCQVDAKMALLYELALAFLTLVRERRGEDLESWREQATQSGIEPLARFAGGLQDDLAAVQSGLTLPWSNGIVEGQVNRLKLLKRQGYGRSHVALLRQRMLHES